MDKKTNAGSGTPSWDRSMHIYTAPGEKVIFLDKGGSRYDEENARKHLVKGNEYTVERLEVDKWRSAVFLKEFPFTSFNSVMFSNVSSDPATVDGKDYNTWHCPFS